MRAPLEPTMTTDEPFHRLIVVQRLHTDDGSMIPMVYTVYARSQADAVELIEWWLRWKMEASKGG